MIPNSFWEELIKLGAIDEEKAWNSYEQLQNMDRNKPTVGQVGRYAGLGAVTNTATSALRSAIKGEKYFKPGLHPFRTLAADATHGALAMGALPFARQALDRHIHQGNIESYLSQDAKTAKVSVFRDETPEDKSNVLKALAAGSGFVALKGAWRVPEHARALLGVQPFYHGTSNAAAKAIRRQGLDPLFGGGPGGGAAVEGQPHYTEDSRGKSFVSKDKGTARMYAQMVETGKPSMAAAGSPFRRQGTTLSGGVPYEDFNSIFTGDRTMDPRVDFSTHQKVSPAHFSMGGFKNTLQKRLREPSSFLSYVKNNPGRFLKGVGSLAVVPAGLAGAHYLHQKAKAIRAEGESAQEGK